MNKPPPPARPTKSFAQLVTSAWGWALVGLFAALVFAQALYLLLPMYTSPRSPLTPIEEFMPLMAAGGLWLVIVRIVVHFAIRHGRGHGLTSHDFRHIALADTVLFLLAGIVGTCLRGTIGATISTFIISCLLTLSLMYLAITRGVGVKIPKSAWLYPAGIVCFIVALWV